MRRVAIILSVTGGNRKIDEMAHLLFTFGREVFEVVRKRGRRLIVPVHEAEGYV